jgi:phosphoglycolate phosphatase-like HAD superfamily hydrolase
VDLETARSAGVGFVGVAWGIGSDELRAKHPDLAKDASGLRALVAGSHAQ